MDDLKTFEKSILEQIPGADESKAEKLAGYMQGILEYNKSINLTAIKDPEEFILRHYADSLAVIGTDEFEKAETVIDVGTGGGFPGVPLAVMCPEKKFVLADSLAKRLAVIDELCEKLGIVNISTVHGRAEDLGKSLSHREKYDFCVSRAVANMSTLSEYCLPFVKVGGCFAAYKTEDSAEEIEAARKAIEVLGGKVEKQIGHGGEDRRHMLIFVKKVGNTPKKYPRKAGTPAKSPIL